jgi:predicted phosphate transport protein (TIGR00153 family)
MHTILKNFLTWSEELLNFTFLPAEVKFYDYFEKASSNLVEGAHLLKNLVEDFQNVDEQIEQITEIEHKGDFIVHEVTELLPRTLITPIDSEDIMRLVSALDDAMDAIQAAAQRMAIYQVTDVKKPARRLANLIYESAQELDAAIKGLHDKREYTHVRERIVQINTLENNGDRVLFEGLSSLVSHRDDMFEFMRWKEIYELLEATTDRIEDAGDIILRVTIANA